MNIRHSSALALIAWYMMVPPVDRQTMKVLDKAPLGQWEIYGRFDTTEDCEREINRSVRSFAGNQSSSNSPDLIALGLARCIASNDPRVKPIQLKPAGASEHPSGNAGWHLH